MMHLSIISISSKQIIESLIRGPDDRYGRNDAEIPGRLGLTSYSIGFLFPVETYPEILFYEFDFHFNLYFSKKIFPEQ